MQYEFNMQIQNMNLESWVICGGRIILGTSSWTNKLVKLLDMHPAASMTLYFVYCPCMHARSIACTTPFLSIPPVTPHCSSSFTSPPFQIYFFSLFHRIILCNTKKFIFMIQFLKNCLCFLGKILLTFFLLLWFIMIITFWGENKEAIDLWPVKEAGSGW